MHCLGCCVERKIFDVFCTWFWHTSYEAIILDPVIYYYIYYIIVFSTKLIRTNYLFLSIYIYKE